MITMANFSVGHDAIISRFAWDWICPNSIVIHHASAKNLTPMQTKPRCSNDKG